MADQPSAPAAAARRPDVVAWAGQAALYALFALALGVFSHWPPYRHLPDDPVAGAFLEDA